MSGRRHLITRRQAASPSATRACATTLAGIVAQVGSLALWEQRLLKEGPADTGTCQTHAVVRDLLALA